MIIICHQKELWGRSRLVWDYYRVGIDPLIHFRENKKSSSSSSTSIFDTFIQGTDTDDGIQDLLPTSRKTQTLGKSALDNLQDLYNDYGGKLEGGAVTLSNISKSSDGTTKLLIKLIDGQEVETVIIPFFDKGWSTICISSQVGCKQGCSFCATGKMGLIRNLTSTEILGQFFYALKICRIGNIPEINNVVFMGMGEPTDAKEEVIKALNILTNVNLFHMGLTKVTVSTVAPTPDAFTAFKDAPCVLAWSVHAANDKLRKRLVPTTKYTMNELRQGLIDTLLHRPQRLRSTMLEVALIQDINDSNEAAEEMAHFAKHIINSVPGIKLMVNLIPFNDIGHPSFRKPSMERVVSFQKILWDNGIFSHIRATRGDDASGACGQLATKSKSNNVKRMKKEEKM
eukprot:CAMPEP_0178961304 /NCGR_PEP_ID=MMETSP0789-20121207/13606_1 /TAXON_ID=3005 /ORGANISM="Rhizosolenia setigera, Strain CCMP 1694" /LENGTH=398 /DNA_ID=CAMNT_0020645071 /DNA_START=63 /DNA_END=1259 /DNA_ORIENTATION=-